jgi:hypothetical protein
MGELTLVDIIGFGRIIHIHIHILPFIIIFLFDPFPKPCFGLLVRPDLGLVVGILFTARAVLVIFILVGILRIVPFPLPRTITVVVCRSCGKGCGASLSARSKSFEDVLAVA